MGDESDRVNQGKHPNPQPLVLVPDQQLLQVLVDEQVDAVVEGHGFVDGVNGGVGGHAVVGAVVV